MLHGTNANLVPLTIQDREFPYLSSVSQSLINLKKVPWFEVVLF